MKSIGAVRGWLFLSFCVFGLTFASSAATSQGNWIGTWAASPNAQSDATGLPGNGGTTYREIVHVSAGGNAVRVVMTNEFGLEPLTIGAAQIAISASGQRCYQSVHPCTADKPGICSFLRLADQLSGDGECGCCGNAAFSNGVAILVLYQGRRCANRGSEYSRRSRRHTRRQHYRRSR